MKNSLILFAMAMLWSMGAMAQQRDMQFWRPYDQRGLNIFETGKADTVEFDGISVRIGGAFAQQFQSINHENTASPVLNGDRINTNQLMEIGSGMLSLLKSEGK